MSYFDRDDEYSKALDKMSEAASRMCLHGFLLGLVLGAFILQLVLTVYKEDVQPNPIQKCECQLPQSAGTK